MSPLILILLFGFLMSLIALSGALVLLLKPATLDRILLSLVGLSAGALLGGAFFHMLPAAGELMSDNFSIYLWTMAGFLFFLVLEQFLHWHHCHLAPQQHTHPVGWLVLVADAVHNFIGGMFVGAAFITDTFLGVAAWLASAAHEVPQELGDFGVLLHAGWEKRRALLYNFISALTFPLGGVVAYFLSGDMDVSFLIPFAAGNFIYIAAVDLVPEVRNSASPKGAWRHWAWFFVGLLILLLLKLLLEP